MNLNLPQKPKLRPHCAVTHHDDGSSYILYDSRSITPHHVTLDPVLIPFLEQMTGRLTVDEIHQECEAELGTSPIALNELEALVEHLSQGLFLFDQQFLNYMNSPNRYPVCVGVYPEEPEQIAKQVEELFTQNGGAGLPEPFVKPLKRLRALLLPHMDYARGNVTYGWGMKTLLEQTSAKLFVIIATSHYSPHRFTLTRKNFTTPLGTVETDQDAVNWLGERYGNSLFDDLYAHLPEHSIEIEVLLLQQLSKQPFRIVPLLVGSFHDCIAEGVEPSTKPDIARMVETLREFDQQCEEEVCFIISGDLAHIGPKFGDPVPVHEDQLRAGRIQDERLLETFTNADFAEYHRIVAAENDSRRICGYPPTWFTLAVLQPSSGQSLHYQQYIEPDGHESVSFTAAAFRE